MTARKTLNLKTIYLLHLIVLTMGCSSKTEKIDGSDTTAFRLSREAMEKKLSVKEKETLEKAMRVMLVAAMDLKFNDDAISAELTLNEIIMKKTHAKNYDEILYAAESYLKTKNEKEKNDTRRMIDDLLHQKHNTDSVVTILNTLKGSFVKADLDDNGYLTFYCEFQNNSKEHINTYGIGITAELLQEDGIFISCANVNAGTNEIAPGGKTEYKCAMAYTYQQAQKEYTKN